MSREAHVRFCERVQGKFLCPTHSLNHLTSASKAGVSASYLYDPSHRQGQKTVGSTKTRYIYAGFQRIAEYDGTSGSLLNRFVYGTGLDEALIQITSGGTVSYFHHDRMGNIVATADNTGAVTNRYKYSSFGESAALTGTTFGFQGQRYDAETGLYYMKMRYYDPKTGRFLQPDPIGYGDGLNLYRFVGNNPNNFTDSMGLAADGSRLASDTGYVGPWGGVSSSLGFATNLQSGGIPFGGIVPGGEGIASGSYPLQNLMPALQFPFPSLVPAAAGAGAAAAAGSSAGGTWLAGAGAITIPQFITIYVPNMLGFGPYAIGQLIALPIFVGYITYGLLEEVGNALDRILDNIDDLYNTNSKPMKADEWIRQQAKKYGIPQKPLHDQLDKIKKGAGLRPNDNAYIDKDGTVTAPNGEVIGDIELPDK